jgi:DnaJ-class molecular chaperone
MPRIFTVNSCSGAAYAVLSDPKKRRQYDSYFFADSDDEYSGEEDDEDGNDGDDVCGKCSADPHAPLGMNGCTRESLLQ